MTDEAALRLITAVAEVIAEAKKLTIQVIEGKAGPEDEVFKKLLIRGSVKIINAMRDDL